MILHAATKLITTQLASPVSYALHALQRDFSKVLIPTPSVERSEIHLIFDKSLLSEQFRLQVTDHTLLLFAADDLGFVYGIYEISRRFLGILPFWFWNDQAFSPVHQISVAEDFSYTSTPPKVRYRGWFLNDETLLTHWSVEGDSELPFVMAFEALLRLHGNLIIPGTDTVAHQYQKLAADMGLILTHHHAEPLGAKMFARAYPELEAKFSLYPDKFRQLWKTAIQEQADHRVIWNIGFRGQGDCPFWEDDPAYDTPKKRGALISDLIREQYLLVKESKPDDLCCTNLYGETMELYQQGYLTLPNDVIRIWADNGYGKMVSRRQGNHNPRIPSLPAAGDSGMHGLYYHASFYDLQAASHITMLPNSAAFVKEELTTALSHQVTDYWLINCSNVKAHTYFLDLIATLWEAGTVDIVKQQQEYASAYYSSNYQTQIASCINHYAKAAISYGSFEDDHAGDQFYHHVPRILISDFLKDQTLPSASLKWLCDLPDLESQNEWCLQKYETALAHYEAYLKECEAVAALLSSSALTLWKDTLLLQARLYQLWAKGCVFLCTALRLAHQKDYREAFYHAGLAKEAFLLSYLEMKKREHDKWAGYYTNECQTDIRQTAYLCGYLMSYVRNLGEGPHFFAWMRALSGEQRVFLQLNTEVHPTDEELFQKLKEKALD